MAKKKASKSLDVPTDKLKAVEAAMAQIEKSHGKGSIMKLGSGHAVEIPVISTGCIQLDAALGCGGFPKGRTIEIYGRKQYDEEHEDEFTEQELEAERDRRLAFIPELRKKANVPILQGGL